MWKAEADTHVPPSLWDQCCTFWIHHPPLYTTSSCTAYAQYPVTAGMEELPLLCSFCDHTHSWLSWMFTSDAFLLRPVPPYLSQLAEYCSLSAPLLWMPLQQKVSSTSTPQLPACFACLWVGWAWVSSDPKAIWPCSAVWANKADLWEGSFWAQAEHLQLFGTSALRLARREVGKCPFASLATSLACIASFPPRRGMSCKTVNTLLWEWLSLVSGESAALSVSGQIARCCSSMQAVPELLLFPGTPGPTRPQYPGSFQSRQGCLLPWQRSH